MEQQAASSSSGGSKLPVRCRRSYGRAQMPAEVRGRRRARAARPPAVGGVDAREGVQTPESSSTVATRRGREHGRRRTWAMGGQGVGPRHLKVKNEATADRLLDVDGTVMGRRWRVSQLGL